LGGGLLALTLLFTGCSRNNDEPSGGKVNGGNWTFKGKTYTAANVTAVDTGAGSASVLAVATNGGGLIFMFKSLPAADGDYKVVSMTDAILGSGNIVGITVSDETNKDFYSAAGSVKASVKVSAGKISITLPEITVYDDMMNPGSATESGKVYGTITQTN
jgi:hypothetical protein